MNGSGPERGLDDFGLERALDDTGLERTVNEPVSERAVNGSGPERALTSEQEQAVQCRHGSLLLAAGAGSGKTAVLVERFVQAVMADGIAPSGILAITFTERAAWEMRQRLRLRLRELGERDLMREVETAILGTFHGFCARVLGSDPLAAGIPSGFAVLAEGIASRVREDAFEEALRAVVAERSEPVVDLLAAYGFDRLRGMVLGVHEQLRSRGQRWPRLPATASPDGSAPSAEVELACELIDRLLTRFGEEYESRKLSRGSVDFDDLELGALQLLRGSDALREHWAQRFELIMVDEFQDTNPRQLELLAAIERDNLFMVGDEWQSIYGFRHADVSIFRERSAELGRRGARLALTLSFRSVPGVIDAVNRVFGERFGESYTPLRAARERSNGVGAVEVLLTDKDGWDEDPLLAARVGEGLPRSSLWRQAEARHLARRVDELLSAGRYGPGDVAVLLRATKDLYVYERALAARGVPTLAAAGGFWSGAEVRDLMAYLRALANPLDEVALYGVLASPLVGLSSDSLALIARSARSGRGVGLWRTLQGLCHGSGAGEQISARDGLPLRGGSLAEAGEPLGDGPPLEAYESLPGGDGELLVAFCERFAYERRRLSQRSLARVLRDAVAATGYLDRLDRGRDGSRAQANLRKLMRLASDYERTEGPDLRGLIDHAEHLAQAGSGSEPDAPVAKDRLDAVRLMSIHAAKGLEFPVVCIADLGRSPGRGASPDMIVDGDRIGLRLARVDGADPRPELDYEELRLAAREAEAREEDRILYVAMTRARDLLLLSGACRLRRRAPAAASAAPIEWLAPALIGDLDRQLDARADEPSAPRDRVGDRDPRLLLYGPSTADSALASLGERDLQGDLGGVGQAAPAPESALGATGTGVARVLAAHAALGPARPPRAIGIPAASASGTAQSDRVEAGPPRAHRDWGEGLQMAGSPPSSAPPSVPVALSYTSLTRLERCGYRHYLEAVLGLKEQERAGEVGASAGPTAGLHPAGRAGRAAIGASGPRAAGELAHAVLQRMDFARGRGPDATEIARRARELGIEIDGTGCKRLADLLGGLMGTELAARIAAASHLQTEQPFAFSIGRDEPLMVGTFDLCAHEQDGVRLIVDYKSGGGERGDPEEMVAEEFGAQRLIYALAALTDGAEQVEVVHWFLRRPERPVSKRYGSADMQALSGMLRERIEGVAQRGFTVSERPHRRLCDGCPGRRRLCSWTEEETLRALPAS